MGTAVSLLMIAAGAIMAWAVTANATGFSGATSRRSTTVTER